MSWDRSLMYQLNYINGIEHRNKGINYIYAPVAGPLGRDPTGGRNWEGFSPDSYLSGIAFGNAISGMQSSGAVAIGKHYILYEQEHYRQTVEWNSYGIADFNITEPYSSNCDDRTFHELYLWPWYDAVKAGAAGIMSSYNQANNTQLSNHNRLQNDILKGELGFQGFIISDDGSQYSGVLSALAGMDATILGDIGPNGIGGFGKSYFGANLTLAVLNGSVPEYRLDDMATRVMAAYFYLGQDQDYPELNFVQGDLDTYGYLYPKDMSDFTQINQHVNVLDDHAATIRTVGSESAVLLKNTDNALPLRGVKQLGIFGEDAGPSVYGPNAASDRGSDNGTLAMGWGSGSANFPYLVSPLEAIAPRAIQNGTVVQYVLDNYANDTIDSLATQATTCLAFINADSGEGYIEVGGNYGDRNNLTAWLGGDALVQRVAANCSDTIVVIHAPGPLLVEDWIENPNITAVVFAGLPGQESGNGLADVLFGDVNPSGHLPWTIGKTRKDYGTDVLYQPNGPVPQINFTEGLFIDYRHFDQANIEPRYPFGYGLSYTTFDYGNVSIEHLDVPSSSSSASPTTAGNSAQCPTPTEPPSPSDYTFPASISSKSDYIYPYLPSGATTVTSASPAYPAPSATVTTQAAQEPGGDPALWDVLYRIHVSVTNNGTVAGKAVPQAYLDLGNGEPSRQLRGFNKTAVIQPGERVDVTMELRRRDVSIWDVGMQMWREVTGWGTDVGVYVGEHSRDVRGMGMIGKSS
ncbi:MAG: hypothetical protein Q9162_006365 [Coniocarpon cinnabarinum]